MNKISILTLSFLFLAGSTCASATIIQETGGGKLKAQLDKVQLGEIMDYVEDKYGVTFKGDTSALQSPVTVSFNNLDLEGMLKKVLARKNFFLVYNKHGEVIEVRLLAGNSATGLTGKTASLPNNKQVHAEGEFPADIFNANGTTASGLYPNAYAFNAAGENKPNNEEDEITKFKVDPNAKDDPITSFKVDPKADDEITRYKVDPNASPEKDPAFKVIPNVSPPGESKESGDDSKKKL